MRLPWWAKMCAKVVLSRVPIGYRTFAAAGMFRHGAMDRIDYALDVVRGHVRRAGCGARLDGLTVLEIGPGDSVATALVARALGARACVLVDAGAYASRDLALYRRHAAALVAAGFDVPDLDGCDDLEDLLEVCSARYCTEGIESLRRLEADTVDVCWSQAVLEHVRLHEVDALLRELRRVCKPTAVGSHRIDLQDHLAKSLNNLRFSARFWEHPFVARSGFYTNRLRYGALLARFRSAGFEPSVTDVSRWPALPLARTRLAPEFRALDDDELCVAGFNVLLR